MSSPGLDHIVAEFEQYSNDLKTTRMRVVAMPHNEYKSQLLQAIDAWGSSYYDLKKHNRYGDLNTIASLGARYQNIQAIAFHLETGGETQGVLPTGQ